MNIPVEGSFLGLASATWIAVILDLAVKGVAILGVCGLLAWCLRRQSPALLSTLWTLGFAGLLAVALSHAGRAADPELAPPLSQRLFVLTVAGPSPARLATGGGAIPPSGASEPQRDAAAPVSTGTAGPPRRGPHASQVAAALWLGGALLLGGSAVARWVVGVHALRAEPPAAGGRLADLVARAAAELGVRRRVGVCLDARAAVPWVTGLWRPILVLPTGAGDWSDEALRAVLGHELGHVRRRDHQRVLLIESVRALCWFLPPVWLAAREAREQCERACDDMVLATGQPGPEYARVLLGFARRMRQPAAVRAHGLAVARPGGFESRLLRLLDPSPSHGLRREGRAGVVLLTAALVTIALADLSWVQAEEETPAEPPATETREVVQPVDPFDPAAALLAAAASGDIADLQYALAAGPALLESRDERGLTPLALAAWHDRIDAVAFLLDRGAAIDTRNDNGLTPLFCAIDRGRPTVARLLLARGADPHLRDCRHRTLLHMAARAGLTETSRELIARGVDLNAGDGQGETALEAACRNGHEDLVVVLRGLGAEGDLAAARARRAEWLGTQAAQSRKGVRRTR